MLADYHKVICTFNECETPDEVHDISIARLLGIYNVDHCHII